MKNLVMAYLGDAVFELFLREKLISDGIANVNELQTKSLDYVSAKSQRKILENLINNNILTEEEMDIIKTGRNAQSHKSKTTDVQTYHMSTGFECLIGYLYQNDKERLKEIMEVILWEYVGKMFLMN